MSPSSPLSVAIDVKRLVDAHLQGEPYKGITRYTLRLLQGLGTHPDIQPIPVYLHRLSPQMFGLERATREAAAVDAIGDLLGGRVESPWSRKSSSRFLLRCLHRLELRIGSRGPGSRLVEPFRRTLLARSFRATAAPSLRAHVFHSTVNPLPPHERTPAASRVLTVHDCIYLRFPEFHPIPGAVPAIRKALDSVDSARDHLICDSSSTRRDVLDFLDIAPERLHVVPLSADPPFFRPDRERAVRLLAAHGVAPGSYLIALAQSEVRKNIPRLVEAYGRVFSHPRPTDPALVLVATPTHAPHLRTLLRDHGLEHAGIRILSGIDDPTLAGLLACARASVYVSLYEGFGLPPLEAMASGCPVVVSDNSSLPEVVGEAGIYVDAEDVDSIAYGIERILAHDDLRSRLAAAGSERARSFSWERTVRETVEVYRLAAGESAGEVVAR